MRIKTIVLTLLLFLGLSCKDNTKSEIEILSIDKDQIELYKDNSLDFKKTDFKDRAEELKYIREYLKIKLPEILIEKYPQKMKEAQLELVSDGYDVTLKEAAKRTYHYSNQFPFMMSRYNENNISFKEVKWCLDNYEECSHKEQEKLIEEKIKNIIPRLKNSTLISIKDTKKNEFLKDWSDNYLTITNHYDRYYSNYLIEYDLEKTKDNNIYKVIVSAMDESPISKTIFHYNILDDYFRHITTIE